MNGLGFTMKWNMGWMHDMLEYFSTDPLYRKYHHKNITFSMLYAFSENFLLPVSHDEVVYGKRALVSKMPGDEWRRFANTRAFLAYMYGHPGKKLLFMGSEFGQTSEWNHDSQLEWWLLQFPVHYKLQTMVSELNAFYQREPALYEVDDDYHGFEWIDFHDVDQSVILFARFAKNREDFLVFCCNFTPEPRELYRVGVPHAGHYREVFNTDAEMFGGSNMGNGGYVNAVEESCHGRQACARVTIPPLGIVVLKPQPR
jgi:1,4-alpha-glucan branching enzyme